MSLDAQKLVMLIKQAAVEAVNAKDPMSLKIGEVISSDPLKISINQKITIPSSQILLTSSVRNFTVYESIGDSTESDSSKKLTYTNDEGNKFVANFSLKVGEKVILLRCDGGQKFIVLDRLEAPNG